MKATLFRYDPAVDAAPRFETYDVPWRENITLLEVLMYVYENYDSVAFDYSCRGRVCGRCAMMLDGEPVMACYTPLKEDADIVVEPLNGFPVIRDFVVDKGRVHDRLRGVYNRIRHQPMSMEEIAQPIDAQKYAITDAAEWCARCMSCVSSCPVVNMPGRTGDYLGPAGWVALGLRHNDPYDQGDRVIEAVMNGIGRCMHCGNCDEVCPAQEIDHQLIINSLIDEAKGRGLITEG